jgi:hypothetical protein
MLSKGVNEVWCVYMVVGFRRKKKRNLNFKWTFLIITIIGA